MGFQTIWATGDCLPRWFHKGAVVSGYGGLDLVLVPWGENGKRGVTVIACDATGTPRPGEREREHCTIPLKTNVMVRSARDDIRSGIAATHEDVWFDPRRDDVRFGVKGVLQHFKPIRKGYRFQIKNDQDWVCGLAFGRAAEDVARLSDGQFVDAYGHIDPRFTDQYMLSNMRPGRAVRVMGQ